MDIILIELGVYGIINDLKTECRTYLNRTLDHKKIHTS